MITGRRSSSKPNSPIESKKPVSPFRRLMIAQDTGSAIVGPARADLYWGAGEDAGRIAGRIRHPGRFVMLLPRELDMIAAGICHCRCRNRSSPNRGQETQRQGQGGFPQNPEEDRLTARSRAMPRQRRARHQCNAGSSVRRARFCRIDHVKRIFSLAHDLNRPDPGLDRAMRPMAATHDAVAAIRQFQVFPPGDKRVGFCDQRAEGQRMLIAPATEGHQK